MWQDEVVDKYAVFVILSFITYSHCFKTLETNRPSFILKTGS